MPRLLPPSSSGPCAFLLQGQLLARGGTGGVVEIHCWGWERRRQGPSCQQQAASSGGLRLKGQAWPGQVWRLGRFKREKFEPSLLLTT